MKEVALSLGWPPSNILLEEASWDTPDQARFLKNTLRSEPFYLVTSANHMPRSMALFKKLGMQPIPAPTDFGMKERQGQDFIPYALFPGVDELQKAETAVYEYLGLAWAKLRGRI